METSKRRLSCPLTVQYIWDSIANLRVQRQVSNKDRIYKILSRQYNMTLGDVERQLKYAVRDNLISCVHRVGCKGSRKGVEAESYWFFNEEMSRDGHDWYCFECHRSGEVFSCDSCFRVYHPFCVKEDVSSLETFICPVCKLLTAESAVNISKNELNILLGYTCNRLKEKVSGDMALTRPPSQLKDFTVDHEGKLHHHIQPTKDSFKLTPLNEDKWRQERLIYKYVDMAMMEEKASKRAYNRLEEYQVDAQTIVHNVVIYYGVHSSYADLARQMLRDCIYDLTEIQQCRSCYRMSNEKVEKYWFCQPCRPPHELVYAKQRGYPYWPAKVIRKLKNTYDVRFFGGFHQRAKVERENVKPISTNVKSLHIKRSSAWNKAMEELHKHTAILDKLKLVPISTLDGNEESETESEEDPKIKTPFVKLNKLDDVEDTDFADEDDDDDNEEEEEDEEEQEEEEQNSDGSKEMEVESAICNDQDDMNVVSSSSQVTADFKSRNATTQTGNKKFKYDDSCNERPSSSKYQPQATNQMMKELRGRLEAEFTITKEAALRELAIKLDKKHFEDSAILTSNEKEKRVKLEERLGEKHVKEMAALKAKHSQMISEIKKKQWCWNCEAEAIYHCCWNTSYCGTKCQQLHWQEEHKFSCRHKRP